MGNKVFYATHSAFMQSPHTRVCLFHPTPRIRVPCLGSTRTASSGFTDAYAGGLSLPHTQVFSLGWFRRLNASNGLSIQPFFVGGFIKQKRPATSVAERFILTLHPSLKRGRARRKVFITNMSIFLS